MQFTDKFRQFLQPAPSPLQYAEARLQSLKLHIFTRIKRKKKLNFLFLLQVFSVLQFSCFAKLVSFVISAVSRNCKTRPHFCETRKLFLSHFRKIFVKWNFIKNPNLGIFTSSFLRFAIFVFCETRFIRNFGSFAKLQNSSSFLRNTKIIS
jgi:hypothetical protein